MVARTLRAANDKPGRPDYFADEVHSMVRWYSTQESVRNGEPTVLAIIETVAAMSTSIWIGVHYGTWMHIAIGFCIAPFLLLRTDESCDRGIRSYIASAETLDKISKEYTAVAVVHVCWLFFGGLATRVVATIGQLIRAPFACIAEIPSNWWRLTTATDFAASPEYIPHPQSPSADLQQLVAGTFEGTLTRTYSTWREIWNITDRKGVVLRWLTLILFTLLFSPLAISALIYRFSIKSTAIGWFPLLWALKPTKSKYGNWEKEFKIELDSKMPQLIAVWSAFCLLLLTVKYIAWALQVELATRRDAWIDLFREWVLIGGWRAKIAASPLAEAFINYVRPGGFPPWDIAIFFNAILGILIWLKIRHWVLEYKHDAPPADESIRKTLGVVFFFRHLLVSYIILCDGLIIFQAARKLPVPEISWHLLPL